MTYDFLIAGGGIGGAVLGTLLGRGGRKVLVLEKNAGPPGLVRPEALWPSTLGILEPLLSASMLKDLAIPLEGVSIFRNGAPILQIKKETFEHSGVRMNFTDPSQTREALLRASEFELRRGVEVLGVLKERERVVGVKARDAAGGNEFYIHANCTVGDDGAHSVIREGCGIKLETRLFPLDFVCFGFDWPASLPRACVRMWLNDDARKTGIVGLGAIPMPGGKGAALLPARPRVFDNPPQAHAQWKKFTASDPLIADVTGARNFMEGMVRVRRPWGHATHYGADGALLIGDAVHPVSPAGGQGANMSVADAAAVAEIVLSGSTDVVAEYERRRREANERSVNITRQAAFGISMPEWLAMPLLPFALAWVDSHPETFEGLLKTISTTFQERV